MDFNPTVTKSQLLRNNTSAADSFAGFLPGLARASAVGLGPFDCPQDVFFHRCDWYSTGPNRNTNHPDIGISSNDPFYCAKTCRVMKAQGGKGALFDWYGKGSVEDNSLLVMRPELEKQNLQFAIAADKGIHGLKYDAGTTDAARTVVLLNALNYARATYFSSPMYLRDEGKPIILFFGFATADFDWPKIRAAFADCKLIFRWEYRPVQYGDRPYADGYFGWTDNSDQWVANVKLHAPGKLIFLGLNARFDNTDPVICPWGKDKHKIISAQGGMTLQNQVAVGRRHPEIKYASFNTWNDYPEKSAVEPGVPSEQTLTLGFNDIPNTLSWNDLEPAFDHMTLYLSKDGENLMPIGDIKGATSVDLTSYQIPVGPWKFLLEGIGESLIQNIVSNTVQATEFVDWK